MQELIIDAGEKKKNNHVWTNNIMVDFSHIDKYGHANYSFYLNWYETGHRAFLKNIGLDFQSLEEKYGLRTLVISVNAEYLAEVFQGDSITVGTEVDPIRNTSMTYVQEIKKGDQIVSRAHIKVVFVDKTGRPVNIPQDIRAKLLS